MDNSQAVSKVINTLKSLGKDNRISRRYVLQVLRDRARNLIAQKLGERTVNNEQNLYSEVACLEMEKVSVIDCPIISFRMCKILMKSKKPLPELVFSRLGSSISQIYSLDREYDFTLVTEEQYKRNKKRRYSLPNEVYVYLGADNHLYIPDHEILSLNVELITMNTEDIDECSECSKDKCKSGWDYEFIVPQKIEDVVFKEAIQIISMNKQLQQDPNPNGLENA